MSGNACSEISDLGALNFRKECTIQTEYSPVQFLQESGKGFFVKQDGCALALREELQDVISNPAFAEQMKDVIEYRAMDYYQRRYRKKVCEIMCKYGSVCR